MSFSSSPWTGGSDGSYRSTKAIRSAPGKPRASTSTSPSTVWTPTALVCRAAGRARSSSSRTRPSTRFASRAITWAYSRAAPSASRASSSAEPCSPASGFLISWARPAARASKSSGCSAERGRWSTSTAPTQAAPSSSGVASTASSPVPEGLGRSIDWLSCARPSPVGHGGERRPPRQRPHREVHRPLPRSAEQLLGRRVEVEHAAVGADHQHRVAQRVHRRAREDRRQRRCLSAAVHVERRGLQAPRPRARRCGSG